jgi:hypothetical protein
MFRTYPDLLQKGTWAPPQVFHQLGKEGEHPCMNDIEHFRAADGRSYRWAKTASGAGQCRGL